MHKAYKYHMYPNATTEKKLSFVLNRCRELYNAALSERKDAYKYAGKSISYYEQQNDLSEIKHEIRPEYQDITAHVCKVKAFVGTLHNFCYNNPINCFEEEKDGSCTQVNRSAK